MSDSKTVQIIGSLSNGQTGIWNSTTNQFEPGIGAGIGDIIHLEEHISQWTFAN